MIGSRLQGPAAREFDAPDTATTDPPDLLTTRGLEPLRLCIECQHFHGAINERAYRDTATVRQHDKRLSGHTLSQVRHDRTLVRS